MKDNSLFAYAFYGVIIASLLYVIAESISGFMGTVG